MLNSSGVKYIRSKAIKRENCCMANNKGGNPDVGKRRICRAKVLYHHLLWGGWWNEGDMDRIRVEKPVSQIIQKTWQKTEEGLCKTTRIIGKNPLIRGFFFIKKTEETIVYLICLPLTVTLILDFSLETVVYRGGLIIISNEEISG